jgi:hypothetical protein
MFGLLSVQLLLAFASTFSFHEINDREVYSLPDMCVFRNGTYSWTNDSVSFCLGTMYVTPQFQHDYISAVMECRSRLLLSHSVM